MKKITKRLSVALLTVGAFIYPFVAAAQFTTVQGGTGTSSPTGILFGDRTLHLKTVNIGTGCTFSIGTLSCPGTGSTFAYPFTSSTFGITVSATTTPILDYPGLIAATSTIGALTATSTFNSAGLTTCNSATNALTWASGTFGCNTISGGSVAGSNTYVQYNKYGVFGGDNFLTIATSSNSAQLQIGNNSTFSQGSLRIVNGISPPAGFNTIQGENDGGTNTFTLPDASGTFVLGGNNAIIGRCAQWSANATISTASAACDTFAWPFTATSYGVSTSTTLGLLNGLLSTASSTFTGSLNLPALSNGGLAVFGGLVSSGATTTAGTGLTYSGNAFNCNTANASTFGCLSSTDWNTFNAKQGAGFQISTTSPISISQLAYYTGTSGTSIGGVSTSTLTASSPLTGSFTQVGSGGSLGCQTASGSQAGCLSSTDWTTFNNKQAAISAGTGITLSGATISQTSYVATSSGETAGNLAYWTSTNGTPASLGKVATSSASCSGFITCSGFSVIGGSAPAITTTGTLATASGGTNHGNWTIGSIPYASSATALAEDNSNLFWNGTNHQLGIGTTLPDSALTIVALNTGSGQSNQYGSAVDIQDGNSRMIMQIFGGIDGTLVAETATTSVIIKQIAGNGRSLQTVGNILSDSSIRAYTQFFGTSTDSLNNPSFSFNLDTNTGIYHPATGALGFVTGGSERIRITSAGNVGIATTSPGSKLTVNGDIGTDGAIPAVSACGSGAAITTGSTDTAGEVTEGTLATGCTITFAAAKARAPFCTVSSEAGLAFSFTESSSALTATNIGALSSTKLDYICVQNNL